MKALSFDQAGLDRVRVPKSALWRLALLSCLLLSSGATAWSQAPAMSPGQAQGAWLGQTPPAEVPVPFAPELFSSISPWVEGVDFSPDGKLCLIAVGSATYASAKLYWSKSVDGTWSPFEEPAFIADFVYSNEPVFLRDGKSLQFTGTRKGGSKDFWKVSYSGSGWGQPEALPGPINSGSDEFRGSYMADGAFYFASERSGINQVYKASWDSAGAPVVSLVGPPISVEKIEADPCIAPDGSYLVFMSCKDNRSSNNYVSFADGKGGWGSPVYLSPGFNSGNDEYGAHLGLDGNYLFFTRHGKTGNTIFWVAASAVKKLRP